MMADKQDGVILGLQLGALRRLYISVWLSSYVVFARSRENNPQKAKNRHF